MVKRKTKKIGSSWTTKMRTINGKRKKVKVRKYKGKYQIKRI